MNTQDLSQIKQIVRTEIQAEVQPLRKDISELKTDVGKLNSDMKHVKKEIGKLRKDVNVVIDVFDRRIISNSQRITRVEDHLHLKPLADYA